MVVSRSINVPRLWTISRSFFLFLRNKDYIEEVIGRLDVFLGFFNYRCLKTEPRFLKEKERNRMNESTRVPNRISLTKE